MMTVKNYISISADGFKLKKGMTVYILHTFNAGKKWYISSEVIQRTNKRGMVSFDVKLNKFSSWHYCRNREDMVGDHRIYRLYGCCVQEMDRRNFRKDVLTKEKN